MENITANQFDDHELCPNGVLDALSLLNFQSVMGSDDSTTNQLMFSQVPEFPGSLLEDFPAIFRSTPPDETVLVVPAESDLHGSKKRKAMDHNPPETSSGNTITTQAAGITRKTSTTGRGKRAKSEEDEKPKEVVHVRAKRGQATDSHSLAERVRRGKINERLKCLQDIVPGCHKTMGMAVMLDEIINYVQSLQNQVEFLSMKLTAASTFHDFNLETATLETMQKRNAYEELIKMQKQLMIKEEFPTLDYSQMSPFDHTFGRYPSLP